MPGVPIWDDAESGCTRQSASGKHGHGVEGAQPRTRVRGVELKKARATVQKRIQCRSCHTHCRCAWRHELATSSDCKHQASTYPMSTGAYQSAAHGLRRAMSMIVRNQREMRNPKNDEPKSKVAVLPGLVLRTRLGDDAEFLPPGTLQRRNDGVAGENRATNNARRLTLCSAKREEKRKLAGKYNTEDL